MTSTTDTRHRRSSRLIFAPLLFAALAVTQYVDAASAVTGPLTVTEHEPPFPDSVNSVSTIVSGGIAEIAQGDGSAIGGILQDPDFIDINSTFGDNTILFNILGTGTGTTFTHAVGFFDTGYTLGAQYLFTDIHFTSPGHITNVTASTPDTNISELSTLNLSWTDNSISLNVDKLGVRSSSGVRANQGQFLLTITTQADTVTPPNVPEPASLGLLGIGLLLSCGRLHKKR